MHFDFDSYISLVKCGHTMSAVTEADLSVLGSIAIINDDIFFSSTEDKRDIVVDNKLEQNKLEIL